MRKVYLVHVRATAPDDYVESLQVTADSPDDAAAIARSTAEPGAKIDVEMEPLTPERALETGHIDGKLRWG